MARGPEVYDEYSDELTESDVAETKDYICKECLTQCTVKSIDMGIGPHEYWGARGNDVRIEMVSDCCEAEVKEN